MIFTDNAVRKVSREHCEQDWIYNERGRPNFRRAFQKIALAPEAISSQVPGSGTSPPGPPPPLPHGSPFFFLPGGGVAVPSPGFFFPPSPQTPGTGGGAIGVQPVLVMGS